MAINDTNNVIPTPPARNYDQLLEDVGAGAAAARRAAIGLGVFDTPVFLGLEVTSPDSVDSNVEGLLTTSIDADDTNWRQLMLGLNLGFASGGAFQRPDTTRTGWGWGLEHDFMMADGSIIHEAYLTTNGAERAFLSSLAPSTQANVSIAVSGGHSVVTISNLTTIEPYIRVGMKFYLSDLDTAVNVAVDTAYTVFARVDATHFHLADASGVEITNASLASGVMDRGGWGATTSYLPGSTIIGGVGTTGYSTYKAAATPFQAIHSFWNIVSGHDAFIEVRNDAASKSSGVILKDASVEWVTNTFGSLGSTDWGVYTGGMIGLRISTTGLATMPSFQRQASTAAFDADDGSTGTTLTNITGLTGISLVASATYKFRVVVPMVTMTTGGGLKMAFKLTTATLTSINARVRQSTDTDNTGAVSTNFTTTTDQATWFAQNAVVYTNCEIEGTLIVNAGGTIAVQAAQNAAHADNTVIPIGAFAEFTRIS